MDQRLWSTAYGVFEFEYRNFYSTVIAEKPPESEKNFAEQFFQSGRYKSVTDLFEFAGYKVLSEPIEVEFMLQEEFTFCLLI